MLGLEKNGLIQTDHHIVKIEKREIQKMNMTELRKEMLVTKKTNPERSKVLTAILCLAQETAKSDGNREVTEKDIVAAAKKERKMAQESKDGGAPYNPLVFDVCDEFLPKTLNEADTRNVIVGIVAALPEKNMKMMKEIMTKLSQEYGESIDKALAGKIARECLG